MAAAKAEFPNPKERIPTILVVDDEPLIRMTVSDYLQECGFKVLKASNADEAQQMRQSYPLVLDLVFSDVRDAWNKDGFALAQWVRTHRPAEPNSGSAVSLASRMARRSALDFFRV